MSFSIFSFEIMFAVIRIVHIVLNEAFEKAPPAVLCQDGHNKKRN